MKKLISFSAAALLVISVGIGSYWYYSPYLAMNSVLAAAKDKDADKFNEKVDYPRIRESLKGQMSAQMAKTVSEQSGNPFSALGAMLGVAMVNQMVDAFVRPEMVMQMMQDGKVKISKAAGASEPSGEIEATWTIQRQGTDRVIAVPTKAAEQPNGDEPRFVFERSGFATWKLTDLLLKFPGK